MLIPHQINKSLIYCKENASRTWALTINKTVVTAVTYFGIRYTKH